MNSLILLIGAIVLFTIAYLLYGRHLTKKWGIDSNRATPATRLADNRDYVPTDSRVLFGHHFSSIAGAGPITGPILAAPFGWIPVYLWCLFGSIFVGGVHDYGALAASLDNDGKSIGEIINSNVSNRAKKIFNWYAWATITLVVAAFTDICASSFAYNPSAPTALTGPQAGTASILFIVIAVIFGIARTKLNANLGISTILGVLCIIGAIAIGYFCPVLKFSKNTWRFILIVYIILASTLPVWLLLQPRDYLCSFLLYAMMAGALVGLIIKQPTVNLTPFAGFTLKNGSTLFPVLFVTVACGAISGFHSLISSGTTSKQLKNEKEAQMIGYGSMLVEGCLAVVALIVVCYLSKDGVTTIDGNKLGAPAVAFANGVADFMNAFGVPLSIGKVFVTLAYSAFALTSLDTATRIGRYLMQELAGSAKNPNVVTKSCNNMYVATGLTIVVSVIFLVAGYAKIWPIFGSANQLLAALALLAVSSWVLNKGKKTFETLIPVVFMFAVTFTALVLLIIKNFKEGGFIPLAVIGCVLFVLAILQVIEAVKVFTKKNA